MNEIKKTITILIGLLLINCALFAQNTPDLATFKFDSETYDYGTINENDGLASHIFKITNTGKTPLVIKQVTASCGCTTPNWTKDPIAPGKTGEIMVTYNPLGRPGAFTKTITVNCENANQARLTIKGTVAQKPTEPTKEPKLQFETTEHDFGIVSEQENAEHTFILKNVGEAPLQIKRVQASCGCTKPEWTQTEIKPGEEGFVILTYGTKGRIGGFNKSATVYTNENGGNKRHKLIIKGTVVDKPKDPHVNYVDTTAGIAVEKDIIVFKEFEQKRINKEVFYLKNCSDKVAYLSWENIPDYMTVKCADSLNADWSTEVNINIDAQKTSAIRGRITTPLKLLIKDNNGTLTATKTIKTTANYIDDFETMSPLQRASQPQLQIPNTQIEFGAIKGTKKQEIVLKNTGKSNLILHTVTCDDERIKLPQLNGTTIKVGESKKFKISLKAKEIKDSIDTDIYIVCNDPKGPIRKIRITAERAK